uniref:Uncharacterized protein LOC104241103 n=1 Tax=Nicotiana sylvestris TaxID=4096 RepID=A0A1U7XXJ2_NICSY|nr:PREDICTED: uncharacterized protein LOC104241103 [Nicotiana sylvestris]
MVMLIRFRGKAALALSAHSSKFHCNGYGHLLSLYCFRSQFLYSTTSTRNRISTHFLIKYLVDSIGFSKKEAVCTSSKLTPQKTFKKIPIYSSIS